MNGIYFGMLTALCYGLADTLSSITARKLGVNPTTILAQAAGLIILTIITFAIFSFGTPFTFPSPRLLLIIDIGGILLGGLSAISYLALYRGLAQGPLAVVSPLVSAQGIITLTAALIFLKESLDLPQAGLLAVTCLGVILASIPTLQSTGEKKSKSGRSGILAALVAMLGFGLLSLGIGILTRLIDDLSGVLLTLLLIRLSSLLFLLIWYLFQHEPGLKRRGNTWLLLLGVLTGMIEMLGLVTFSAASIFSSIGIAGVLASAYVLIPILWGLLAFR
ncbi:MAG TPA: EamA family transporter, partial [Ktedonobacteraceae bacterium]|nr:EamA family transporter [Ktedonobacteraceae bacterium]